MTQSNLDGKAWRTVRRSTEWLVLRRAWHGVPDVHRPRALPEVVDEAFAGFSAI